VIVTAGVPSVRAAHVAASGQLGRYLVTFVDNHDFFWQPGGRFANAAPDYIR